MFPNLNAEQARRDYTNSYVATHIGISRSSYERKKRNGMFFMSECTKLCDMFECTFEYLFARENTNTPSRPA